MSRSPSSARRRIPASLDPSSRHGRFVIDALSRVHGEHLLQTARFCLGDHRRDAEDIVQDVWLAVLEGDVVLPHHHAEALDVLLQAVAAAARRRRDGGE